MDTDGTSKAYSLKFATKPSIIWNKNTHVKVRSRGYNWGGGIFTLPKPPEWKMPEFNWSFTQPKMNRGAFVFGGLLGFLFGFAGRGGNSNQVTGTTGTGSNNTAQTQTNNYEQQLANLKTLYPKHNIVSDGGGKFSATDSSGHLVAQGKTYEEMENLLSANN